VIKADVDDQLEGAGRLGELEDVGQDNAEQGPSPLRPRPGPLDGRRRRIDGRELEAAAGQVHGVGPGPAADLEGAGGLEHSFLDQADQLVGRLARLPRGGAVAVGGFPVRHSIPVRLGKRFHGVLRGRAVRAPGLTARPVARIQFLDIIVSLCAAPLASGAARIRCVAAGGRAPCD